LILRSLPAQAQCDYDHASVATDTEAKEIAVEAKEFFELVERWIAANHPKFTP